MRRIAKLYAEGLISEEEYRLKRNEIVKEL
ncbi:MAG: SHOCT domain-containing protein [Candidatus Brachytrichaceae bacterium NZ_4S206]